MVRRLLLFFILSLSALSCGGAGSGLGGGAGTGEDSGDGSLETGGPIDIPVGIAKMNGGVDETTLDFTRDLCPSGTADCSTVAGTLTGSLTEETPVGSNIVVFKDGVCQETVTTQSDRSFTQAYQRAYVDEVVSYFAVPSSADCDDLSTLSGATYFVVDSEGNIKFIMTNEEGVVRTELSILMIDATTILYQRETGGVRAVRSVTAPRDGTSEVAQVSLARVNQSLRDDDVMAGILPADLSGIGSTGEVCLMDPDTGAVTCDGHVFFSDRERNLCYPERATWMAAAYKNSDSKMTIAIMNPDTLAVLGGEQQGVLDVPSGEKDVKRMTFYCESDYLFTAKEFTDGTSTLQRYYLGLFFDTLSKSDISLATLYSSSEPISYPYTASSLMFFACGPEGSQDLCYSDTEGGDNPFQTQGTLPAPSVVDFDSATTTISHINGAYTTTYSYAVCETNGGVYVIDKNQDATLMDAAGSHPVTNGGASVIYMRSIGENPEVWKADIGYFSSSILTSDETGLYITNPTVACDNTSYSFVSTGSATCSTFIKGSGGPVHDYVGIEFSAPLDITTLDGTNNLYFMKNGKKYPSEVTDFGTTFINLETGSTNPFSSSGTVTVVIDGDEASTEPIRAKTGGALIQDYQYTIIVP